MSAPIRELAERWLNKAENDLITAHQTLLLPEGPTDTVAFHAQQAVEKALKALLSFHAIIFPRTHDLLRPLDLAANCNPDLSSFRASFAEMSNYCVQSRYPDDFIEPERADVIQSIEDAEQVVRIIRQVLLGPSGGR